MNNRKIRSQARYRWLSRQQKTDLQLRSDWQCESMIKVGRVYTRCWGSPVEVHHLLTRARGGQLLDAVGETYHLMVMCSACHRAADGGDAYLGGLLIEGFCTWDKARRQPIYIGPDEYLKERYGRDRYSAKAGDQGHVQLEVGL